MNPKTHEIRSAPCPTCAVCGAQGNPIYNNLRDRLFTAPGVWSYSACSNPTCKLLWPSPMPLAEDIGKAYSTYYTHASQDKLGQMGWKTRARHLIERVYWSKHFGYQPTTVPLWAKILGSFYYLSPLHRREAEAAIRGLQAVPNGRLFDVGCGSGDWLLLMRNLGWKVEGNDFDGNAVRVGTERGLQVALGSLEQQALPDNSFDAVTLSHVIEHVPDPLATIKECLRILKPGGKVVLLTPNGESLSHHIFKANWRGLEPPRHLHIFSMGSMDQLLRQSGFQKRLVRPFIVSSVIYESIQLRLGRNHASEESKHPRLTQCLTSILKVLELSLVKWRPAVGDCVFAIAVKP